MTNTQLSPKPIDIQSESWFSARDEIVSLTKDHFIECDVAEGKLPFALDDDRMDALAASGSLHITTARNCGMLAGYLVNVLSRNILYNAMCSYHLGWYVRPDYRGKLAGLYLLEQAEQLLKEIGVQRMYGAHTDELDASGIFKRLGWKHIEHHYSKWIGD